MEVTIFSTDFFLLLSHKISFSYILLLFQNYSPLFHPKQPSFSHFQSYFVAKSAHFKNTHHFFPQKDGEYS